MSSPTFNPNIESHVAQPLPILPLGSRAQSQSFSVTPAASAGGDVQFIQVGISACLAGHKVRYNGGHTQSKLCLYALGNHWQWRTFCPEMAAGLGTPRRAVRLVGDPNNPQMQESHGGDTVDLAPRVHAAVAPVLSACAGLDGFVFKQSSPSCGLHRVKVYQDSGHPHPQPGRGLFADAVAQAYPLLPMEEEGRLHDAALYENFLIRVYAYHQFRQEVASKPSVRALIQYHSTYKYLLLAHDQAAYRRIGPLLANRDKLPMATLMQRYLAEFMPALATPANARNHTNALMHLVGYLRQEVPAKVRAQLVDTILAYRHGRIPLIKPWALVKHYIEIYGSDYAKSQRYFNPYPEALTTPHWFSVRDRTL